MWHNEKGPHLQALLMLASLTGFEPAQTGDSEVIELGEEDRSITGPDLTDNHHA